jgi:uncharacterized protein YjbI with pentapeptide repeats
MANKRHLKILESGVDKWNNWRNLNPEINPDLSGADLEDAELAGVNFRLADLKGAELTGADLEGADLTNAEMIGACLDKALMTKTILNWTDASTAKFREADLTKANLRGSWFCESNLKEAFFEKADMSFTDLWVADLSGAGLRYADLSMARLVKTNFNGADLQGCRVYGCSVWDIKGTITNQKDLVITPRNRPKITVDDMKIAQFVYLLLENENIRNVIETIGTKGVLIIGRFTKKRKDILHAIRDELRDRYDLLPIMFKFDPISKDPTIKTLSTLAHLSRFVIADLTDAKSVLQELEKISHDLPTLPVQPILLEGTELPPMADSFFILQSVLKLYRYSTKESLIADLLDKVVAPAENHAKSVELKLAEIRRKYVPWQNI